MKIQAHFRGHKALQKGGVVSGESNTACVGGERGWRVGKEAAEAEYDFLRIGKYVGGCGQEGIGSLSS